MKAGATTDRLMVITASTPIMAIREKPFCEHIVNGRGEEMGPRLDRGSMPPSIESAHEAHHGKEEGECDYSDDAD